MGDGASARARALGDKRGGAVPLTIDSPRGVVAVRDLGEGRFRVSAPDHEQEIVGFAEARSTAHQLAWKRTDASRVDRRPLCSTTAG
jgi:hypothetical protein